MEDQGFEELETDDYVDILDEDEKTLMWESLVRERQRHAKLVEDSHREKVSLAAKKKRKKIADESRRRNR